MSLGIDGVWKVGVWAQTVWADGVWREGTPVIPPTPPPVVITPQSSGHGFFDYGNRRRTPQELDRDRARFGLPPEAREIIEAVAVRQVEHLEADPQKRFEELERELQLQKLAWRAEYLEALNAERNRLMDKEIAYRLRQIDDEAIVTALVAASILIN